MRRLLTDMALVIVVGCCVVVTISTIRRPSIEAASSSADLPPVRVDRWDAIVAGGKSLNSNQAAVQIVAFSDFECPACAQFAKSTYPFLKQQYGDAINLTFRHWPLERHRFAYPAAVAAECAHRQDRFWPMHDVLFEGQKEFGLVMFRELADRAGVSDLVEFDNCYNDHGRFPNILQDASLMMELGARGTPTIMVNGVMLRADPSRERLDSLVGSFLPSTN